MTKDEKKRVVRAVKAQFATDMLSVFEEMEWLEKVDGSDPASDHVKKLAAELYVRHSGKQN